MNRYPSILIDLARHMFQRMSPAQCCWWFPWAANSSPTYRQNAGVAGSCWEPPGAPVPNRELWIVSHGHSRCWKPQMFSTCFLQVVELDASWCRWGAKIKNTISTIYLECLIPCNIVEYTMLFTYEHDIAAYKYGLSTFPLNVKNNLAGDEVTDGHLFSSHFGVVPCWVPQSLYPSGLAT